MNATQTAPLNSVKFTATDAPIDDTDAPTQDETNLVDNSFVKAWKKMDQVIRNQGTKAFGAICLDVKTRGLSRAVVHASLREAGKTKSSADSIATRIMNQTLEENAETLEALCKGEITQAEARARTEKSQNKPKNSPEFSMQQLLKSAAGIAINLKSMAIFLDDCQAAYNLAESDAKARVAASVKKAA